MNAASHVQPLRERSSEQTNQPGGLTSPAAYRWQSRSSKPGASHMSAWPGFSRGSKRLQISANQPAELSATDLRGSATDLRTILTGPSPDLPSSLTPISIAVIG